MRTEPTPIDSLLEKLQSKPSLIVEIEARLKSENRLGINIGHQEGLLLRSLCSQLHVEKVVEIGTQFGCSATWMAMGLRGRGKIWTFEKDPYCAEQSRLHFQSLDFLKLGTSVELFEGDALNKLPSIENQGPFDLIFIDANKSAYDSYTQWAKAHLKVGGLIVVDNIFLFGSQFEEICPESTPPKMWHSVRSVLEDLFQDAHFSTSLVPTVEGLLLATKTS